MINEFLHALGFEKLLKDGFKTNDFARFRIHKDEENLLQMIYQILGTYYEDHCADELRYDPVMGQPLEKKLSHHSAHCPGSSTVWMMIRSGSLTR